MTPQGILETILYAQDLAAIEDFCRRVLGMEPFAKMNGRQVFYKCGDQMLLYFNPTATEAPAAPDARLPVPSHGARGPGHVCFRASATEIDAWCKQLENKGVDIEADFEWPGGGRSMYFRDPAGNCMEFAEPRIWGF